MACLEKQVSHDLTIINQYNAIPKLPISVITKYIIVTFQKIKQPL
jgi:hypothetical protein